MRQGRSPPFETFVEKINRCAEIRHADKEKKMKKKKGKRLLQLLIMVVAVLSCTAFSEKQVQAAENVNYLDDAAMQDLWDNSGITWDSLNHGMNLTDVGYNRSDFAEYETGLHKYVEAPGILGFPDTATYICATYDNIGVIGGRSVSARVIFRNFYGRSHGVTDNCNLKNNSFVHADRSGILLDNCFWNGYFQHNIYAMSEEYYLYYTGTNEAISCKGSYLTVNSLNVDEEVKYDTEGQDGGNLKTFVRADNQLKNNGYGDWLGNSDNFTDQIGADDYTKNSVTFQLCTDNPKFQMKSVSCDFWHAFNISPIGATIPTGPQKTGYDAVGNRTSEYRDVNIGDTLNFDVSQSVEYLGTTGGTKYNSFVLVDNLPQELSCVDAYVTDGTGARLGNGQVNISVNNNQVSAVFSADYLKNGMQYIGETYILHVSAKVNEKAADNSTFSNTGSSIVNQKQMDTTSVNITLGKAELSIAKTASRYEWRVGDTVDYTIQVKQTKNGCMARNVRISDTSLPDGLAVSDAGDAVTVDYPQNWTDSSGASHQTAMSVNRQGTGFSVTLDRLAYNTPVTVRVKCVAKDSVNGKKITNTATAQADNASAVSADATVYINSPKLSIEKTVPQFEYQTNDTIEYTIRVRQTENGCLARNIQISDTSLPEGLAVSNAGDAVTVDPSSARITRQGTGFVVSVAELGNNTPVTIRVKCVAKDSVNGRQITNRASAKADNASAVSAAASVYINSPKLAIEKAASRFEWQVDDTVEYTIRVRQTENGCLAKNVRISDTSLPAGLAVSDAADAITVDAPPTWTYADGSTHQTAMSVNRQGTGFVVSVDGLGYNSVVTIKVKCIAKQSVNGQVIGNTATAQGANVRNSVNASASVYINSPKLAIEKKVPHYEWRVGDTIEYTMIVKQTENGCQAKNVRISDLSLPEGLAVSDAADAITVDAPPTWTYADGSTHQTAMSVNRQGTGFVVSLDGLGYNVPVTVKVKCVVKEAVNGAEVINTATAQGDNVKISVSAAAKVYINSPGVHMEKECDKSYAKPGDLIGYTLSIDNRTVGTLARNVRISDKIGTDGLKLQKNSIVLLDGNGNPIDDAKITVTGNSFVIETSRTLICTDANYTVIDKMNGNADGGKKNPEGIKKETAFTVEYQASATKVIDEGGNLENKATVSCDEGTKDEDEEIIPVNGPYLDLKKSSNKSTYQVGETGHYKLTIRETRESLTAKDIIVKDNFLLTGMTIIEDSIKTQMNGEDFHPESVELNEAKNGFVIKTGKNLTDTDKLVVSYDVSFSGITPGEQYSNLAVAKGSNTKEVQDRNDIFAEHGESPKLVIDKKAQKEQVKVGETDTFELKITQENHYVTAKKVIIKDSFDAEGAEYVKNSFKITDKQGNDITDNAKIVFTKQGFAIKTGVDLGWNEYLKVTYDMSYPDEALKNQTVINKASASADDTDEVMAAAQVKVNPDAPELTVIKEAEAKTLHVGKRNIYTIKVMETKQGETARNVVIQDSFDTAGAEYVKDSFKITDQNGKKVEDATTMFDQNGFVIKTGKDLAYNQYVLVTYCVDYTEVPEEGKIVNTAAAKADNASEVTDQSAVKITPDAPELSVEKKAKLTQIHAGEKNTYTITIKQTKKEETAKNVVIQDSFNMAGVEYVKDSFKLVDQNGKEVEGIQTVFAGNGFTLETGRDLGYNEMLTLTYQVVYEKSLAGQRVKNSVSVTTDNGKKDADNSSTVDVMPDAPELSVEKKAKLTQIHAGEKNTYTITIKQTKEGETAKNVVIQDSFNTAGAEYVKDSFKLVDQDGKEVEGIQTEFAGNGFTLETGRDLGYNEMLTLTYQTVYEKSLAGHQVKNSVSVTTDDGKKNTDDSSTIDVLADTPELSVEKKAERSEVNVGETNTYTVTIKQTKEGSVAKNIVIKDKLENSGASYVNTSFKLVDQDGKKVTGVKGTLYKNRFTIKTKNDLKYDETYILTYQVTYTDALAGKSLKNTVLVKADNADQMKAEQTVQIKQAEKASVPVPEPGQNQGQEKPAPVDKVETTGAPQTGLHDHIWMYTIAGIILIAAGIGATIYLIRHRKKK